MRICFPPPPPPPPGYLPPSSLVNVDADKEAAHFAAHTTGFVPIAKPIGHDLFEASASERNNIQHQPKFQQSQPQVFTNQVVLIAKL